MPVRSVDLAAPLDSASKALIEHLRCVMLVESKYDTKVIRSELPERTKFTLGTIDNQLDLINAKTSDRGYSPYVGISSNIATIRSSLIHVQECYLASALEFALKETGTSKEE